MLDVLQQALHGHEISAKVGLNAALAVVGGKVAFDTLRVSSTHKARRPQLLALTTAVLHVLLNIFGHVYANETYPLAVLLKAQSLACFCGAVLVGWMEYLILEGTKGASLLFACSLFRGFVVGFVAPDKWMTVQAITFGMMFFINHCGRTKSPKMNDILASHTISLVAFSVATAVKQPYIGYVLPTFISAFRALNVMGKEEKELYRTWVGGAEETPEETRAVEEIVESTDEEDRHMPEEETSSEISTPTDDDAWAPELEEFGGPKSNDAEPIAEPKKLSAWEQAMNAKLEALRNAKPDQFAKKLEKKLEKEQAMKELDDLRKEFAPKQGKKSGVRRGSYTEGKREKTSATRDTNKGYMQAPSADMCLAADANKDTAERNTQDLIESMKAQDAAEEAHNNKMDAHHQAMDNIGTNSGPATPSLKPAIRKGSLHNELDLQLDWQRTGGTTIATLEKSPSQKPTRKMSQAEQLAAMKHAQKQHAQERILRETNCPGTPAPKLGNAMTAADHDALEVHDTTTIMRGETTVPDQVCAGIMPALNRAVATPDQEALANPETAKLSDGIIHIRANVLYQQMRAMLSGPEAEIEALNAQLECCKTIIQRLKSEIMDRKREAGIQKTMAFTDRHSWSQEQKLRKDSGGETASGVVPETLNGNWTVMHHNGDIHMSLEQEEEGMICGDAIDFIENVSGKYDPETRGFCMRIDIGPHVFQLIQGEMVSDFGIVMLRNFSNGVELPTEFCIMIKSLDQSDLELESDDVSDEGWYNDIETSVTTSSETAETESPDQEAQPTCPAELPSPVTT